MQTVHTACNVMTERLMSLTDRAADCRGNRTASGNITVRLNSRCWYQSIAQQYLKRCSVKNVNNYKFRPIVAIIRLSSESMVILIYRIGMIMSRWWNLNTCDDCYMLLLRVRGVSVVYAILDCAGDYVCSLLPYVSVQLLFVHSQCLLLLGLTIAYKKHHRCWDLTIVPQPCRSYKVLLTFFRMKNLWWPQ